MMMKLHWSPRSPYVRKVMVCAHELDQLGQLELVRSVAAMLTPNDRLMQDNPLSKIPTLVLDNGFTVFDSAVICEYLDDVAGGSLFPRQGSDNSLVRSGASPNANVLVRPGASPNANVLVRPGASPNAKWQALRWHAFGDGILDALILWRNERERDAPLRTLIAAFELKLRASLKQLDDEAQALAAMPLSIGHITLGCALGYLDYRFDDINWRKASPRLAEWYADIRKRPSFITTVPIDG